MPKRATNNFIRDTGIQIREARFAQDLTQEELAERAGISAKYVSAIENGGRNVNLQTLHRIVTDGLGLTLVVDFTSGDDLRIPVDVRLLVEQISSLRETRRRTVIKALLDLLSI